MNTNKVSACTWKALLFFEMLIIRFKVCLPSEKNRSKIWQFIHFSDRSHVFQSMFWKMWKRWIQNFLCSKKSERGIEVYHFTNKIFPGVFKSIAMLSFHKKLAGKWWRWLKARLIRRILAAPNQIVVFGATKMRRLTQWSTAVVIWVDLNNKIRLVQSHNATRERLGVRRRIWHVPNQMQINY